MDIFSEFMVKRKRRPADYIKVALCIVIIIGMLLIMPFIARIPFVGIILFLACAGVIYFMYNIIISINLEYEYIFTNGELDVDKIIAARRRRRVTSLNARAIEIMASVNSDKIEKYLKDSSIKRKYACTSPEDKGVYFVIYSDEKNKNMLIFNPNDEIKDGFRRLNPQKVFIED